MRKSLVTLILVMLFALTGPILAQVGPPAYHGNNFVVIPAGSTPEQTALLAGEVSPSAAQLAWQRGEMAAFFHFGMNTFTGKEWGDGSDDPSLFNPSRLDARQWIRTVRDAGMKLVILTAKHHDGFCLWPSALTDYSVKSSPWKKGTGDVVAEVASACREYGVKFGFYLSPWDRHEPSYGDSAGYNRYFMNQLRELLTNYGDISEVWFDGACGEGPNGKRQVYDWPAWYALIRELQPGAVIAVMGPDVRWVGTESGVARETEWSVIPDIVRPEAAEASEEESFPADPYFIPLDRMGPDLGGTEKLRGARTLSWYPAEADVSIRPGWFWHPEENEKVKSPVELTDIYFQSVGRNAVLLLNIPPDRKGRIHSADIRSLKGFTARREAIFRNNLLQGASSTLRGSVITYELQQPASFNVAMLREDIRMGQRVAAFHFETWDGTRWKTFASGTTAGHRRLLRFPLTEASRIRLVIDDSRGEPALLDVGLYFDRKASLRPGPLTHLPQ